ncbi:hypothetical protein O0544_04750 [Edwardsiella anguillarum]|nr:hypothetical protein [Edwardsiella anguillarum]
MRHTGAALSAMSDERDISTALSVCLDSDSGIGQLRESSGNRENEEMQDKSKSGAKRGT